VTLQDHSQAGADRDEVGPCGQISGIPVVDEAMLAAFYEAHAEKLFKFVARKVGPDDGGELFSQVLEEFFVWWPANPEHPKPVATLYQIARCRLSDYFRHNDRKVLTVEAEDLVEAAASGSYRDELADIVPRADLGTALAGLTERERQALAVRYLADQPVKECAEVLETGIDNTKKILKTALKKLRKSPCMDGYKIAQTAKEARR
jgi:RNA polymerase sigma factor (sigma-70 family)